MLVPIVLLVMALVVLLWQDVSDQAMQALKEHLGQVHDARSGRYLRGTTWAIILLILGFMSVPKQWFEVPPPMVARYTADSLWMGMDTALIAHIGGEREELVRYGRALVSNTAYYLGPKGIVAAQTNGMNCQNCHLDAGTRPWGNNYSAVWSTYPKFRERSGAAESVEKRINDCFERSLNGTALDSNSREMRALVAYMEWLGTGMEMGSKPKGSGLAELPFMDRPADPIHGEAIYTAKCESCHQKNGEGIFSADGRTYQYPPLWGAHSYNIGAGLYRLSRFAGYVKNNMPQGVSWESPQLTDEEAWDVAAYVNSRQRPELDLSKDWPNMAGKPVDHPFGPFIDQFPEAQHKFGPFGPIAEMRKIGSSDNQKIRR